MKKQRSSNASHDLYHTVYSPAGEVKATLLILHGMCEHSGRYQAFAQYLQSNGVAVLTYDHLGHGKTARNADELGFFGDDASEHLQKDALLMAQTLQAQFPDVPHLIMGHSMGSFILRNLLADHSQQFAGAILMGTSHTDPLLTIFAPFFRLLNHLAPTVRAPWAASLSGWILTSKLKGKAERGKQSWLSANTKNIDRLNHDPLCHYSFTHNGYAALFTLMACAVNDKGWYQTIDKGFPILFASGADDPLGNMGRGIHALVTQMQQTGFIHLTAQLYPEMRHEPLHESDNEAVFTQIYQWIEAQN